MKVKIEVEKRYKITINGVAHSDFKKVSDWEGLAKFQNEDGIVIVDNSTPDILTSLLDIKTGWIDYSSCPVEAELVKLSPCLMPDINDAKDMDTA